jgi:hypothetical protein
MAHLQLDDVVLLGRTFEEYALLFALDNIDPQARILDVAGGVSSFTAEANTRGWQVTASDRIYGLDADLIESRCRSDLDRVMNALPPIAQNYVWDTFPDVPALKAQREKAYQAFIPDYRQHGAARYVPTTYPQNSFGDGQFSLALVSHFLFLYDEQLDYDFHKAVLSELLRITTDEIRIVPLVSLSTQRSVFVDQLRQDPAFAHCQFEIVPVNYEFIKGGNVMLRIKKPAL